MSGGASKLLRLKMKWFGKNKLAMHPETTERPVSYSNREVLMVHLNIHFLLYTYEIYLMYIGNTP